VRFDAQAMVGGVALDLKTSPWPRLTHGEAFKPVIEMTVLAPDLSE
jgi:hypothetical protein